jgi:hypothetical protein
VIANFDTKRIGIIEINLYNVEAKEKVREIIEQEATLAI